MPVPHSSPWLRFQSPLSEPSRRIYRTRLSSGIMRLAHGTPWQPRTAGDLAKAARLPPCGARRFQWTAEPVDASTTPRLGGTAPSLGHVMLPGFPVIVRGNRHGHSRDPSPFGHRSSPEAPSLHRHYPVSPVLRASPPPSPAQPDPRGLVSWHVPRHRPGLPVLRPFPSSMRAAANTPAEPVGACVAHFPTGVSLPCYQGGSASASYPFRGLLGVYSRCGPHGR